MTADQKIIKEALRAVGRTFYGGVLENRGLAPMGKGHDNDGMPFNIESCLYTKPVYDAYDAAIRNRLRAEIVVKAGVKTTKSFVLENCAADHVCNRNGDTAIFFGSGDVADTVSTTRIVDDFRGMKRFSAKLKTISNKDGRARHQVTNGAIKFPDKTFFLLPANLNETQQKNLGFAGVQDAFVTAATGIIEEIIARTTQYRDAIVFLESQGGETHFDFDRHYENTNQGELHVRCPICGSPHIFNWKAFDEEHMKRGENFIPVPPMAIPSLDHVAWIEHYRPLMLDEKNRVAGFQRGPDEKIKTGAGDYIPQAIISETHFRCFHCDGIWHDDGEFGATRMALDKSSHYVSANPGALPNKIGFNFPQWINRRITNERGYGWGHIMLEKLNAQRSASEFKNYENIKIWWQKAAARSWDKDFSFRREMVASPGSYDPAQLQELIANAHSINMTVDCQEDADHKQKTGASITGWFWVVVRVWGKDSKSKQIARFFCKSWDYWITVQKHWNIPNDRVMIDCLFDPVGVRNKSVEQRQMVKTDKPHPIFKTMERVVTWKLLQAVTRQQNWKHKDGKERPWSEEQRDGGYIVNQKTGRPEWITVPKILFNKNPIRQQVDALYTKSPGLPEFEYLDRAHLKTIEGKPDDLTLREESGKRTYESQMAAQSYNMEKHKYVEEHSDDHYFWCEQAQVVRASMDGLLGQDAVFQSSP